MPELYIEFFISFAAILAIEPLQQYNQLISKHDDQHNSKVLLNSRKAMFVFKGHRPSSR